MRRIVLLSALLLAAVAAVGFAATAETVERTYRVELDNAFGLVQGSEVKVAGVPAGVVTDMDVNQDKKAVITFDIKLRGFDAFRTDATCSSDPQSLIAPYFIDCQPGTEGEPLDDQALIPVEQTTTNVQPDLVNNIFRRPIQEQFRLIFNEFGTGLAGNPEELNEAILRGAPALRNFRDVLDILERQNQTLKQSARDADTIFRELEDNKGDVARFITEARRAAEAGADRREDLRRQVDRLPVFLRELEPTMEELGELADAQVPLLRDLRRAAPDLVELTRRIPPFTDATTRSLEALGDAGEVGAPALRAATNEIDLLRRVSRQLPFNASELRKLAVDLDDPERTVERDKQADQQTNHGGGFTGFESIINYVYYQTQAITTFDDIGHMLRVQINEINECAQYSTKPANGGDAKCVAWLGPNQPDINEPIDIPPYDPAACPNGSADPELCRSRGGPNNPTGLPVGGDGGGGGAPGGGGGLPGAIARAASGQDAKAGDEQPADKLREMAERKPPSLPSAIADILDAPEQALREQRKRARKSKDEDAEERAEKVSASREAVPSHPASTNDMLEYLFAN